MRILRQHGPPAVFFAALAVFWTFPLILHLSTHLPGPDIGDNMLSLWNFWSMRTALATGTDFFYSKYQFAPVGIDLTLYTHTALPALAGATVLGSLPLVSAQDRLKSMPGNDQYDKMSKLIPTSVKLGSVAVTQAPPGGFPWTQGVDTGRFSSRWCSSPWRRSRRCTSRS